MNLVKRDIEMGIYLVGKTYNPLATFSQGLA